MIIGDFFAEGRASFGYRFQCEQQKWSDVMPVPPRLIKRFQILFFVFIVVVGDADHDDIVHTGASQHERLKRASGTTIAVPEWVHRADMVVCGNGLDNRVMPPKLSCDCRTECIEGGLALIATISAAADWRPENYIPSVRTQGAGFAMVIVAAGYDAPVYVEDEVITYRTSRRLRLKPAVSSVGATQLPL